MMRILDFGSLIVNCGREALCHPPLDVRRWPLRVGRCLSIFLLAATTAQAYPPAPHHEIFGQVRDQWGNPFSTGDVQIILETDTGARITGEVAPGREPGVNYRLQIPMDAGIAPDSYQSTALRTLMPFRIQVRVGNLTYLPIQMQGDYALLGAPAEVTRIDLTLGADSDGDGLPDAWKDMAIAMSGVAGLTRGDIRPDDDLDGDGMTNLQEYIAGTYAWDSADRLWLNILEVREKEAALEFFAIDGRTYKIWGSSDLTNWTEVNFRLPAVDEPGSSRSAYFASAVQKLQVEVPRKESPETPTFFRLEVQ